MLCRATARRGHSQADLPSYYPADYPEIVAAAKKEGRLLVYSSMTTDQWSGVVAQYRRLYPSITVETLDLGTSEITERYLAERGSNSQTADLLATGPEGWIELQRRDEIVDYISQIGRANPEIQALMRNS